MEQHWTRRQVLGRAAGAAAVAGGAAAGVLGPTGTATAGQGRRTRNARRALDAYAAMQRWFHLPRVRLYREQYPVPPDGNPYSFVWPYSQAFAATTYVAALPRAGARHRADVRDRIAGLAPYHSRKGQAPNAAVEPTTPSPPGYDAYVNAPYGEGGDKYYDDNGWLGLDLVQWYRMSGDRWALGRAAEIFRLELAGWDRDPTHARPGGVFWTQGAWAPSRSVMENAATAQLGVHLHWLTGRVHYLRWAERLYGWVRRSLLAPEGLYWDSVGLDGHLWQDFWSYNQGTMIGAGTVLRQATGERSYLRQAREVADTALAYYAAGDRLQEQAPYFNAIFFKNLLVLEDATGGHRYRVAMQAYADEVWDRYRDADTGLFRFHGDDPVQLLEQAAVVQLYALLGGTLHGRRLV